jgi:hypothetical protein
MGQWECCRWGRTTASWNPGAGPRMRARASLLSLPCLPRCSLSALALLPASLPAHVLPTFRV